MATQQLSSIMAVDFGSVYTRAVLIDVVEGNYSLVVRAQTRTTDGFPSHDISIGLEHVLKEMTEATGRDFLSGAGNIITPEQLDRSGVDLFAITASIGRPLKAVVVGLIGDTSAASAVRAASGTYIEIASTVSLDDGRDEQARLNAILLNHPDVIILVGGTESGPIAPMVDLTKLVKLSLALTNPARRPSVIYAGNSAAVERVREILGEDVHLLVAENVRPVLENEAFESTRLQLSRAFDRYQETRNQKFARVGSMSGTGVMPTGQSYTVLAEYLGRTRYDTVALLDVGSLSSTIGLSLDRVVHNSIRTDVGLGHSAPLLLENVGIEAIRQHVPFSLTRAEAANYVINKSLYPASVPQTLRDLYIEHALLKAGTAFLLQAADPSWQMGRVPLEAIIVAGSALTNTGNPAYDVLLLLDALQPTGVTTLLADPYGLIAGMGAVAVSAPEVVVQLLDGDNLNALGTCISVSGQIRPDRPVMKIKVSLGDGEVIEETVEGGHLWTLSLATYETALVEIDCQGAASINGKRSVELTVRGGTAGLIVDARGRPLAMGETVRDRARLLPMWVHEMTLDPLQEIDEAWLEPVADDDDDIVIAPTAEAKKPKSRRRRRRRDADLAPRDDELNDLFATPDDDDDEEDENIDELRNVLS